MCDGVGEVRKAARDELRKGAHCIKVRRDDYLIIIIPSKLADPCPLVGFESAVPCTASRGKVDTTESVVLLVRIRVRVRASGNSPPAVHSACRLPSVCMPWYYCLPLALPLFNLMSHCARPSRRAQ